MNAVDDNPVFHNDPTTTGVIPSSDKSISLEEQVDELFNQKVKIRSEVDQLECSLESHTAELIQNRQTYSKHLKIFNENLKISNNEIKVLENEKANIEKARETDTFDEDLAIIDDNLSTKLKEYNSKIIGEKLEIPTVFRSSAGIEAEIEVTFKDIREKTEEQNNLQHDIAQLRSEYNRLSAEREKVSPNIYKLFANPKFTTLTRNISELEESIKIKEKQYMDHDKKIESLSMKVSILSKEQVLAKNLEQLSVINQKFISAYDKIETIKVKIKSEREILDNLKEKVKISEAKVNKITEKIKEKCDEIKDIELRTQVFRNEGNQIAEFFTELEQNLRFLKGSSVSEIFKPKVQDTLSHHFSNNFIQKLESFSKIPGIKPEKLEQLKQIYFRYAIKYSHLFFEQLAKSEGASNKTVEITVPKGKSKIEMKYSAKNLARSKERIINFKKGLEYISSQLNESNASNKELKINLRKAIFNLITLEEEGQKYKAEQDKKEIQKTKKYDTKTTVTFSEWNQRNKKNLNFSFNQSKWGEHPILGEGICKAINYRWIKCLLANPSQKVEKEIDLNPNLSLSGHQIPVTASDRKLFAEYVLDEDLFLSKPIHRALTHLANIESNPNQSLKKIDSLQQKILPEVNNPFSMKESILKRDGLTEEVLSKDSNSINQLIDNLLAEPEKLARSNGIVDISAFEEVKDADGKVIDVKDGHALGLQIDTKNNIYRFWDVNHGFYTFSSLDELKNETSKYIQSFYSNTNYNFFGASQYLSRKPLKTE